MHIPESKAKVVSQSKCVDSASFSHFPRPCSSFKQSKLHSKMLYSFYFVLTFTMTTGIFDHRSIRGPDQSADPWVPDLECCTWSAVLHPVLGLECRYLECHVFKCLYYGCWVQGVLYLECRVTLSAASDRRQQGTARLPLTGGNRVHRGHL